LRAETRRATPVMFLWRLGLRSIGVMTMLTDRQGSRRAAAAEAFSSAISRGTLVRTRGAGTPERWGR